MKKIHEKIDEDVVDKLHQYKMKKLGRTATISDTIRQLLKEVK